MVLIDENNIQNFLGYNCGWTFKFLIQSSFSTGSILTIRQPAKETPISVLNDSSWIKAAERSHDSIQMGLFFYD